MVGGINPNVAATTALGAEARQTRAPLTLPQRRDFGPQDVATVSAGEAAAGWRAARESVQGGLSALDLAIAAGREALSKLNQIAGAGDSGQDTRDLIQSYAQGLADAGADLLSGGALEVTAEPGQPPVSIKGVDASFSAPAGAAPDEIGRAAHLAAGKIQTALMRFDGASQALQAHAGFLGSAEQALGARADVEADGARLLALQVQQGLQASGASIAGAQPGAVLNLFKALGG